MLKRTLIVLGSLLVLFVIGTGCQPHEIHWYLREATPEQREAVDNAIRANAEARFYATLAERERIRRDPFLTCVRAAESDRSGGYAAQNPRSTASGAYQFLDSTWR